MSKGEGAVIQSAPDNYESSVEEGVWRYARVERASVIVDAEDYFLHMQQALLSAKRRAFLIGWDFDTRIHLTHGRRWWQRAYRRGPPRRLGSFIGWMVRKNPELEVRILKWSVTLFQFLMRGTMLWDVLRWARHKRITFKFDQAHPLGCSHHQKIAVLDDRLAVCGGIDITDKRWDTRRHDAVDHRRRGVNHRLYGPWHDATMMLEGEAAAALAEIGRQRWVRAGGGEVPPIEPTTHSLWPEKLPVQYENVEIGIARTRAEYEDGCQIKEIESLFKRHIREARHFIYAESQYFASRVVGEAILARLQQPDPPEIVIVHPDHADGWLEQKAMDTARAELVRVIRDADNSGRFSLWMPFVGDTAIYVHAKLMIVDDRILRIGSANLNNRSLGLDSECDVFIDSSRQGNGHAAGAIARLRYSLLAEHLGLEDDAVPKLLERHGSMRSLIENSGRPDGRHLRSFQIPELSDMERTLAQSEVLDPERPDEIFEPFARGGLFRAGTRLANIRKRLHWRRSAHSSKEHA